MKNLNIFYWTVTSLFCAFMTFSAIPDILMVPDALNFMTHLGYPIYLIPFIGFAKLLGSICLLMPRFFRLKEWAYAGMFFDLAGATYSVLCTDGFQPGIFFMILPVSLLFISYYLWHKRLMTVPVENVMQQS
jgi:hypothetical protein